MTQKHFIAVAETINKQVEGHRLAVNTADLHTYAIKVLQTTAESLADQFAVFNPNFKRSVFLTACGF